MGTYNHKDVLADYTQGRITVEMAMGHSLQHIDKLYEAQAAANTNRRTEQAKLDALEGRVHTLQGVVDRLTAIIEGARAKQKRRTSLNQPESDQP